MGKVRLTIVLVAAFILVLQVLNYNNISFVYQRDMGSAVSAEGKHGYVFNDNYAQTLKVSSSIEYKTKSNKVYLISGITVIVAGMLLLVLKDKEAKYAYEDKDEDND